MSAPTFAPMLASSGRPDGDLDGWVAETKLDGWRAHVAVDPELPGGIRVTTRTGRRITEQVRELRPLVDLGCPAVLDGELIAAAGRCDDFYAVGPTVSSRRRAQALTFVVFDLLWLDGHDTTVLPYTMRRSLLLDLELPSPAVVVNMFGAEDLDVVLAACEAQGVEGVVMKHLASPYKPGLRSSTWRKVKCDHWRAHAERRRVR